MPESRESELVETDISAVMEWAWKLKSEHSRLLIGGISSIFRYVPRYRGQDIVRFHRKRKDQSEIAPYPAMRDFLSNMSKRIMRKN